MIVRLRALAFGLIVAYLVVAPLFFSVATIESFEFPKVLLLRTGSLALLALGAVALVEWALSRQLGVRLRGALVTARTDPILLGGSAWLLAGALSTAASLSPHVSLRGAHQSFAGFATLLSYSVLFMAARLVVRSVADLRLALIAALAAGAGATTYGLLQLFGLDPIAWGVTPQSGAIARIASTMGNPNFLGGYLAMVFPAGLCFAIHGLRGGARVVPAAIALVLTAGVIVSLATLSRGVAIAYGAGVGVLVLGWWRTGERAGLRWIAGFVAALVLLGGVLAVGTETGRDYAGRAFIRLERTLHLQRDLRIEFWSAAVSMYRAEPVLGVGLDAFQLAFPRHARKSFRQRIPEATPGRAHNELLHTAATQGTVGVVAGLFFLGALLVGWLRALRRAGTDAERTLLIAVGAGLAALLARNLVGFTVVGVGGLACVFAGALARRAYGHTQECDASALSPRGGGVVVSVGIVIAAMVFLGDTRLASAGSLAGAVSATAAIAGVVGCIAFGLLSMSRRDAAFGMAVAGVREEKREEKHEEKHDELGVRRAPRAAAIVLVAVVFIAAAIQTVLRPAAADMIANQARRLLRNGRPDAAVPLFERAVRLDPGREIHWVELGLAHHGVASKDGVASGVRRNHLQRSLASHVRSAKLVPEHVVNQANVARGFAELGSWTSPGEQNERAREAARVRFRAEAYVRFDAALELDPFARSVYFDATKAARGFRDEPNLVRYARAWHEHHPTHAQARAQLGIAAMMRADWVAAEAELIAATHGRWARAVSDEVGNWVNLASTQLELGKPSDAHASSEAALERVPRYLPALRARALAYEALAVASDSIAPSGKDALQHRRRAIEHRRRAAADWSMRLVAQPDDAEAREALARLKDRDRSVRDARAPGRGRSRSEESE